VVRQHRISLRSRIRHRVHHRLSGNRIDAIHRPLRPHGREIYEGDVVRFPRASSGKKTYVAFVGYRADDMQYYLYSKSTERATQAHPTSISEAQWWMKSSATFTRIPNFSNSMDTKEAGSLGGKARARKLSKKRRSETARLGGKAGGGRRSR
jgi:hypothetical protein